MVIGALAGFLGGIVDNVFMRLADVTLAFPPVLLAMAIAASLGPGLFNTGLALVIVWWPIYARLMRAQVLAVKRLEHVEAAIVGGGKTSPHPGPPRHAHVLEPDLRQHDDGCRAGDPRRRRPQLHRLGAQPPTPEWGQMISEGASNFYSWWIALGPGLAIFLVSISANFLGDGLRDLIDPRSGERR